MLLCTGALGHGAFLPGVFTFRPVQRSVPEWSPGAATAAGTLSSAQPPREACAGHSIEDIIREPLMWRLGSQVSMRIARGSASLL